MHTADHERIANTAAKKWAVLNTTLGGYVVLSAFAGAYVGFGIALIFSLGGPLAALGSPYVKLVMGASFGIALTLVVFAGSELFTGNNMVGVIGGLSRSVTWPQVIQLNLWSWVGNLLGSLALAGLIAQSGVFAQGPAADLIQKVAAVKVSLGPMELFVRGLLCNWLVCLAVWTASRTTNEAAKIMLIFWCLFAFIATGFEHSVANQSFLGLALFLPHGETLTWGGFWYNQFFVVLGNVVGGGALVGGLYWMVSPYRATAPELNVAAGGMPARVLKHG